MGLIIICCRRRNSLFKHGSHHHLLLQKKLFFQTWVSSSTVITEDILCSNMGLVCCRNSLFWHVSLNLLQIFFVWTCVSYLLLLQGFFASNMPCLFVVAENLCSSISLICYCSNALFKHVSQLFLAEILWLGWNCYNKRLWGFFSGFCRLGKWKRKLWVWWWNHHRVKM